MTRNWMVGIVAMFAALVLALPTAAQMQELEPFQDILGYHGFKDKNGKTVIDAKYDEVGSISEGAARVRYSAMGLIEPKWGYIDTQGNYLLQAIYNHAKDFHEGLAAVSTGGYFDGSLNIYVGVKWGFIDKEGTFVIPAEYQGAMSFSEGLAAVRLNGKWGFVDKNNQIAIPFSYDRIGEGGLFPAEASQRFNDGRIQVKQGDQTFFIDKSGRTADSSAHQFSHLQCIAHYWTLGALRPDLQAATTPRVQHAARAHVGATPGATEDAMRGEILPLVQARGQQIRDDAEAFGALIADVHACDAQYGHEPVKLQ